MAAEVNIDLTSHWPCISHLMKWFIHLMVQGLSKEDEHPAYTPLRSMAPFIFYLYRSVAVIRKCSGPVVVAEVFARCVRGETKSSSESELVLLTSSTTSLFGSICRKLRH